MLCGIVIGLSTTTTTNAYSYHDYIPKYESNAIALSSDCPNDIITSINKAVNTWKTVSPTSFKWYLINSDVKSPNSFCMGDGYSTIGTPLSYTQVKQITGHEEVIALCGTHGTTSSGSRVLHTEVNIAYNTGFSYTTSATDTTRYNYQGVFTHEIGHAYGLGDLYSYSGSISNIPTMYGIDYYKNNIVYSYFRTLETDDKNGKSAVASLRNF